MYHPLLAAAMLAVPVVVAAQSPPAPIPATPGPAVQLSLPAPQPGSPYSTLFRGRLEARQEEGQWRVIPPPAGTRPAPEPQPRRKVVCGMTLLLVGPGEVDPRMPNQAPPEGAHFTLRKVPPPMCGEK